MHSDDVSRHATEGIKEVSEVIVGGAHNTEFPAPHVVILPVLINMREYRRLYACNQSVATATETTAAAASEI